MASAATEPPAGHLPAPVARVLDEFVNAARGALGDTLRAVVLFGSAAENRLRATSDVNLVVVLSTFDGARVASLAGVLGRAHAAARLEVMWLLESELADAADAFATKFADIARRHRVLYGFDPFEHLEVPRAAAISRLRQVLLNLILRLRASFAADAGREERLALRIAEAAGPLRACAAELLDLEGRPREAPREALLSAAAGWTAPSRDLVLKAVSEARETRHLAPGVAADVLLEVIALATYLHERSLRLG